MNENNSLDCLLKAIGVMMLVCILFAIMDINKTLKKSFLEQPLKMYLDSKEEIPVK